LPGGGELSQLPEPVADVVPTLDNARAQHRHQALNLVGVDAEQIDRIRRDSTDGVREPPILFARRIARFDIDQSEVDATSLGGPGQ